MKYSTVPYKKQSLWFCYSHELGMGGSERIAVHAVLKSHVNRRHLVLLLPLHSPILEPNLNLTLSQAQSVRNLDTTTSAEGRKGRLQVTGMEERQ